MALLSHSHGTQPTQQNPPGEFSAQSDQEVYERQRRWRRSPLGIALAILGLVLIVVWHPTYGNNANDYHAHPLDWAGGALMIALGLYGLTRRGAQREAQYNRVNRRRQLFYSGPRSVLGVRTMSGALVFVGIVALLLFTFVH